MSEGKKRAVSTSITARGVAPLLDFLNEALLQRLSQAWTLCPCFEPAGARRLAQPKL